MTSWVWHDRVSLESFCAIYIFLLTINNAGLQVLSVTAGKVTFSTRGPEESDEPIDHPGLDKLILLPGLDADQVHAMSPADVTASDPVHLEVLGQVILPREEIIVTLEFCVFDSEIKDSVHYIVWPLLCDVIDAW